MNNQSKLLEFYTDVLNTLDITVKEDNGLYLNLNSNKSFPFMHNNIQLFLPTKDVIKTSLAPDDSNNLVVVKELFNPLNESADKGDNISLIKLKKYMDDLVNNRIATIFEMLLSILSDKKIDINDMFLLDIITGLNEYNKSNVKQLIDEQTVKCSNTLYKHLMNDINRLYTHIFIKNGGKVDDIQYNRISVISFPLIEEITKLGKTDTISNVVIRNKDRHTFKVLHEKLFDKSIDELINGIQLPSKDNNAPAFITLLMSFEFLTTRVNKLIDSLMTVGVDVEGLKELKFKILPFKIDDLTTIVRSLQSPLKEVPSNVAVQDTATVYNNNTSSNVINKLLSNGDQNIPQTKLYSEPVGDSGNMFVTESVVNNQQEPSALDAFLGNSRNQHPQQNTQQQGMFQQNTQTKSMFNQQPQQQGMFQQNTQTKSMFNQQPQVTIVNSGMFK